MGQYKPYKGGPLESRTQMMKDMFGMLSGKDQKFRKDEDGNIIFDKDGNPERTKEGVIDLINQMGAGEGSASVMESLRKYDPQTHFEITGIPQTSGGLESFSRNETAKRNEDGKYELNGKILTNDEAKKYNNAIYAAREAGSDKDNQGGGGGGGGGGIPSIPIPTPTPDPDPIDLTPTPTLPPGAPLTPTPFDYSQWPQFGPQYPGYNQYSWPNYVNQGLGQGPDFEYWNQIANTFPGMSQYG